MPWHAAQDEQVRQDIDDVGRVQPPADPDCEAFPGELVDHVQHADLAFVMGFVFDEVVGPDVIGPLRPQPDTGSVVEPKPALLSCFCGTLSPSRRQIRATRLRFTIQPERRSIAVMRR